MAEDLTTEIANQEEQPTMTPVELVDILLSDGTHLRFCTASEDRGFLDYVE